MKHTTKPTPKLSTLLGQLYQLLEDPNRWTTGTLAKNKVGEQVSLTNPSACQFCLLGGIAKVEGLPLASYKRISDSEVGSLIYESIQGYYRRPRCMPKAVVIHRFNDATHRLEHHRVLEVIEIARQHALGAGI